MAVVEPGVVLTPIWQKVEEREAAGDAPYATTKRRLLRFWETQLANPTMPQAVADAVREAIESETPTFRYPVGRDAAWLLELREKLGDEGYLMGEFIADDEDLYAAVRTLMGSELWNQPANELEPGA